MFIFHKVSGSMLMGFGSHFGTLISMDWNSDSSAFIHSRFHYRFLINLSFTSIMVSKSLKFISFFTSRCLKFFYFFGEGFLDLVNSSRAPSFKRFWDHNFFLVGSWIPGVLTNYKLVKSKLEKIRRHTNLFQYPSGFIFLGEARFLPISSAEARISKLPSIGISDVDTGFSPFSYTIPSNNKTFAVSVAYHYLFQQATEHGWVLSHGMYSDMIKKKLNSFINQFLYLFDYRLTALATLDVRISNFSARRKPVFRRKSYRRWRWWLPIRHKFYPSQAFTYSVRDERWAKKYGFLTDLPIDLSVSVYLIDSLRVLARIKLIEDRLFKDNNRKYLRYLNRRSRPRNKGRFNPWLYIIIIILK